MTRDSQKLRKVHETAILDFDRIQTAMYQERMQSLQDRRFYSIAGAQWEGGLGEQFENRPMFEVNKIHLSVIKIFNEYRNNRVTVDFITKDGNPNDKLADICDGLFRADEQDSGAEEAYDNAFEEAVGGGFGALRITTEYEDEGDEENEKQRIRIEPIYDADSSVFFDLDAKRQDKSDAKYCFIIHSMSPQGYEEEYGVIDSATINKTISDVQYDWFSPDVVYVAEYYKVEMEKQLISIYKTLTEDEERYTEEDFENDPELLESLKASGKTLDRERKIKRRRVHKYILSGSGVLEDCGYIAGSEIPIIPNYGKRWFVESVERFMGHVRLAKDMQRIKNMLVSKLAEIASLSTVEKPIFTPEQVAGNESMWADDNIQNYPYLLVNPFEDAMGNVSPVGPIGFTKPPDLPPALAALMQLADIDIKELLGGAGNETAMLSHVSGKAHEMIQKRIDGQSYIYMSNFAKTIRRVGEVWLSMAKEVYVETGRAMKTVDPMGELSTVVLDQPGIDAQGHAGTVNDLTKATFDVAVDVGPSSSSQREATVGTLAAILGTTQDPQTRNILESMIMLNMEGEGMNQTRAYFRKQLVNMGVLEPTKEEAEELAQQSQEPSPQDQALMGMAAEANAKAQKAMADVQKVLSDIELNAAKTAQTYSDVDMKNLQTVKSAIEMEQQQIAAEQARIQSMMQQQMGSVGAPGPQGGPQIPGSM